MKKRRSVRNRNEKKGRERRNQAPRRMKLQTINSEDKQTNNFCLPLATELFAETGANGRSSPAMGVPHGVSSSSPSSNTCLLGSSSPGISTPITLPSASRRIRPLFGGINPVVADSDDCRTFSTFDDDGDGVDDDVVSTAHDDGSKVFTSAKNPREA